jgi:[Skp1-protein]-hydroxyproline N-acetylglucosaminyltransferase
MLFYLLSWYGEQWFMQTDAHMTFATHWDATSVSMLTKAPSTKPILSHYPPGHMMDLDKQKDKPTSRLCGPVFATSDLESQIIRLEGAVCHQFVPRNLPFIVLTKQGPWCTTMKS